MKKAASGKTKNGNITPQLFRFLENILSVNSMPLEGIRRSTSQPKTRTQIPLLQALDATSQEICAEFHPVQRLFSPSAQWGSCWLFEISSTMSSGFYQRFHYFAPSSNRDRFRGPRMGEPQRRLAVCLKREAEKPRLVSKIPKQHQSWKLRIMREELNRKKNYVSDSNENLMDGLSLMMSSRSSSKFSWILRTTWPKLRSIAK